MLKKALTAAIFKGLFTIVFIRYELIQCYFKEHFVMHSYQRLGLEDAALQKLEGDGPPALALGVRARVVQALLHERRVARHLPLFRRREILHVGLDPLRRPKERVGCERIALHPLEERAVHAIPPTVAQQLLLLLFWGALRSLLHGVCGVCGACGVCGVCGVCGGCHHHYGSGGVLFFCE
jgi:hypothetical protein